MRTACLGLFAACAVAVILSGGCAGPRVNIVHTLPAAVPLPVETPQIQPGQFQADGPGEDWIPAFLREQIQQRRWAATNGTTGVSGAEGGEIIEMDGTVRSRVRDESGRRPVERGDTDQGTLKEEQIPYLIRTVDVRAVFELHRVGEEFPDARLETAEQYRSVNDPRVWGRFGLQRPDDPQRVPPVEQILRELLRECVDTALGMVRPLEMQVTLAFRPVCGEQGTAGLKAAEAREFSEAAGHFRRALDDRPGEANLLFNLGLACEGAGDFAAAAESYEAALKQSDGKDEEARASAERARRLESRMSSAGDR